MLTSTFGVIQAILTIFVCCTAISAETIIGSPVGCSDEGEMVPADKIQITNLSCVTCLCKNGFVECRQPQCYGQDGCYMMERYILEGECCRRCKGCYHRGVYHESDSQWRDPDDPCVVYHCKARVVTVVEEICYNSHCPRLALGGSEDSCCTPCKGCRFNGQLIPEDREVTTPDDPCLKCHCKGGHLTCVKRGCPVLQCPPNNRTQLPGQCCPICLGNRSLEDLSKGACLLQKNVITDGKSISPDACTSCTCINGTSICKRLTCPVLTCPLEQQMTPPGECCPHCPLIEESRAVCNFNGKTYEDNESWHMDSCTRCLCQQGFARCAKEMCPDTNALCPANQKLVHEPGQCCPKCKETDGVCTVFGDPHYRTFDGKFFSFQGSCKYLLSADCVGRSFFIRVTNDARLTKKSAWTKTISMKFGDIKVTLGQKMRVKINGKRYKPPFKFAGQVQVDKKDDSILVSTEIGIKILWNGNSFLEVSAPGHFRNRLCGLCGNYNGVSRDDLMTRRGSLTNDTEKFGVSWRVGGRKACDRKQDRASKSSHCARVAAKRKPCTLIGHSVFQPCHSKVNDQIYLESCGMDMCECPSRLCFCEALTAYAHECARLGVNIGDWQEVVGCPRSWAATKDLLAKASLWATNSLTGRGSNGSASTRWSTWRQRLLPTGRPPNLTNRPPPPLIH